MSGIYLDHNATTPVDERVLEAMLPFLRQDFGNASSKTHPWGWRAKEAVERARGQVASLLGGSSREVVFTSGATEADNLAVLGTVAAAVERRPGRPCHIVTQATEHPAVLDPVRALERQGHEVTRLAPDGHGLIDAAQVADAIREDTALVTIMAANNEIGTLQPLAEIAKVCRQAGVVMHTDAAQAIGKVAFDARALDVDLVSLSAHKFYGPKGIGALFVRTRSPRVRLAPVVFGGGQERGLRPGTLNVPGIVGLGEASRLAGELVAAEAARLRGLRELLRSLLVEAVDGVVVHGHPDACLPGTLSVAFEHVDGTALLVALADVAISSGSACSSGSTEISPVLAAIGVPPALAVATIRVSLGRSTSREDVERAGARIIETVRDLRATARR